jgi:hypothetical protein
MWTCPRCKESIEDQFDSCWKCAGRAEIKAVEARVPPPFIRVVPHLLWVAGLVVLFLGFVQMTFAGSSFHPTAAELEAEAAIARIGKMKCLIGVGFVAAGVIWLFVRRSQNGASLLSTFFEGWKYDEQECIRVLLDRGESLGQRGQAAEMLYRGQSPAAVSALVRIALDDTENMLLREEAAGTLGDIYAMVGVDEKTLNQFPIHLRENVMVRVSKA